MLFHVTVQIGFADGSCVDDISFNMHAENEEDVRKLVTPERNNWVTIGVLRLPT